MYNRPLKTKLETLIMDLTRLGADSPNVPAGQTLPTTPSPPRLGQGFPTINFAGDQGNFSISNDAIQSNPLNSYARATPGTPPPRPSDSQFGTLIAASVGFDTAISASDHINISGFTWLESSSKSQLSDGFAASAYMDSQGAVIIVSEASAPLNVLSSFGRGSANADDQLYNGQTPSALTDANAFSAQVENAYGPVYEAGFSLGGAEAESGCLALGTSECLGGFTIGAPGLPQNNLLGADSGLVNYIGFGDPVGNWATDTELASLIPGTNSMDHYGLIQQVGSISQLNNLDNLAANAQNDYEGNNGLAGLVPGILGAGGEFLSGAGFHNLQWYSGTLNLPSLNPGGSPQASAVTAHPVRRGL